jgi:hypothetical protein
MCSGRPRGAGPDAPCTYTPEQRAWIREHYAGLTNDELAAAYNERFGTECATRKTMHSFGSNHRLRKSPEVRARANQANRKYTEEQLEWLRSFIPGHHEGEIIEAYAQRYGVRLTRPMVSNLKTKLGVRSGTCGGQFQKGHQSANKGRPRSEWMSEESRERSRRTQFKKGEIRGSAAARQRPLLDIREDPKDHYLMIKVMPRNAKNSMQYWISLARFEWMRANGRDWPDGHRAVFADRDNRNFDPDNIVPVPEELYAIVTSGRGSYVIRWYDRESLEVALTQARVIRERRRLTLHERRCRDCGEVFRPTYENQSRCDSCIVVWRMRHGGGRGGKDKDMRGKDGKAT